MRADAVPLALGALKLGGVLPLTVLLALTVPSRSLEGVETGALRLGPGVAVLPGVCEAGAALALGTVGEEERAEEGLAVLLVLKKKVPPGEGDVEKLVKAGEDESEKYGLAVALALRTSVSPTEGEVEVEGVAETVCAIVLGAALCDQTEGLGRSVAEGEGVVLAETAVLGVRASEGVRM